MLDIYLGDGAYLRVSDYYNIELYTSDGYRKTNVVILEYPMIERLYEEVRQYLVIQKQNAKR